MKTLFPISVPAFTPEGRFRSLFLLVLSLALFALSSCEKTDYLDVQAAERLPLSAKVRFVNARPVQAGLQFWTFTNQITTTAVGINQASPYLSTVFGNVQINFTEGSNTSYKASYQFGNSATFSATGRPNGPIAEYYHTVFAARRKGSSLADTLILFYDNLTAPVAGKAKIRFVNLAPDAPDVDVSLAGGACLFTKVAYGQAGGSALSGEAFNAYSLGPFSTIDAGTLNLEVKRTSDGSPIALQNNPLQNLVLESGKIYTVFTNGWVNATPAISASVIAHN